jgi:peptidoglycan/xylan/chitin deacetylase (PgdA/CDA1 family)
MSDASDRDWAGPPRDLTGYGASPPRFTWPSGAHVAIQLVVNYEEGSERSWPSGDRSNDGLGEVARDLPAGIRDLAVESTYEYGSRAGVWRLLRVLQEADASATVFAAARALELNPAIARAMVEAGHEIAAHGYRWVEPFLLSRDEERDAITRAVESIASLSGRRPVGWYSRYCGSVHTRELIVEEGGFLYDADAYNDDLPYFVDVHGSSHLVVPYTLDVNDSRFVRGTGFANGRDFEQYLIDSVEMLARESHSTGTARMLSVGLHPRLSGRPGRAEGLRRFLMSLKTRDDVWIARREDIARFWLTRTEQVSP